MLLDLLADQDIFFFDLGTSAVISEEGKVSRPVTILFDRNSIGAEVITDRPAATLKTADLEGFTRSKLTLTCEGESFSLMKPLDDGAGLTVSGLKRV
jgi:hypothetical protein